MIFTAALLYFHVSMSPHFNLWVRSIEETLYICLIFVRRKYPIIEIECVSMYHIHSLSVFPILSLFCRIGSGECTE